MRRKFTNKYLEVFKKEGPLGVFRAFHNEKVEEKIIRVFGWEDQGRSSYDHNLIPSVSKYLFEDLEIIEAYIDSSLENRPGIIKESTKYITVHDTAGAREGSGAVAHMKYVTKGGGGTSWHYSLGNDGIFKHLPHNEVAYHAGDGSRTYTLENSNVKASTPKPDIDISKDGYYVLNGEKSTILAPTNDGEILSKKDINDLSIEIQIIDGYYYIGNTWYSKTYKLIGNGGGNRNSIGIEACIDRGSDIYLTWQRLAKLVAYLLIAENLDLDAVVQHHYFSGKDCPMTMRRAKMWDDFLDLVEVEYFVQTTMKDYEIKINPITNNIDSNGRIKELTKDDLVYEVIITDKDNNIYKDKFTTKKLS